MVNDGKLVFSRSFQCVFLYLTKQLCYVHLTCIHFQDMDLIVSVLMKVSKGANIKNRYNQVPHLTQDANGEVTNSQLDTTNESQKVKPFPSGDHKAHITDAHKDIANTRQNKHKISTKEVPPWNGH